MLGLAAGDALGTTLEFKPQGTFTPIDDIVGGGPFHLEPGQWTDETSMALCLAASLVETGGFDPVDQLERYLRWLRQGYMSSAGASFDVGNTVRAALAKYETSRNPYSGPTAPDTAGNGSLMRLAPVPLFFAGDPKQAIDRAADSSRTTHGAPEALDACRYYAGLILGALAGVDKETLLGANYAPLPGAWDAEPLSPNVAQVAAGSFKGLRAAEIEAGGYVIETLHAALWAFHTTDDFRFGAIRAVNLGDDADTTGAVYGQLAGTYYGVDSIPADWREKIAKRDLILDLADKLHAHAQPEGQGPSSVKTDLKQRISERRAHEVNKNRAGPASGPAPR
ncbi:MAG TPA: ADP-ribosylglycohydrolase family protein [Anaerolineales bacterium]|nr:ADP-ribosylglycohydrolase family protein [Anaerolineales bacterium]